MGMESGNGTALNMGIVVVFGIFFTIFGLSMLYWYLEQKTGETEKCPQCNGQGEWIAYEHHKWIASYKVNCLRCDRTGVATKRLWKVWLDAIVTRLKPTP